MRPSEDEANALGFSVTRSKHDHWYGVCMQRFRPYVVVRYRRKYASVWSDHITARRWSEWTEEGCPPDGWHVHEDRLSEMTRRAAQRVMEAGYRDWIMSGHADISTCLAEDAAPIATVLVEVWDGDLSGLERLISEWDSPPPA